MKKEMSGTKDSRGKKSLAVLAGLLLGAALFAGCGAGSAAGESRKEDSGKAADASEASAGQETANGIVSKQKMTNTEGGEMILQDLVYTEDAADVPNPDRGFYRANDGMVVPEVWDGEAPGLNVGAEAADVAGVSVETRISHMYFDLRNYSGNAPLEEGAAYDEDYRAPEDVSVASRPGDSAPYDYRTHFDYWLENEYPSWPKGESKPLTEDALSYIRACLDEVRAGEGVAIVRFTYDGEGLSWIDCDHPEDGYIDTLLGDVEPDKETVLTHISQIGPVLSEYEDVLMAVDGGFFGPWGEMHSTTFGTDPDACVWLLDALLEAVPSSRRIQVQPGAFLSWYNASHGTEYGFADMDEIPAAEDGSPEARFGFFNDSYAFGTDEEDAVPDDWGSISEGLYWPGSPFGGWKDFDRGRLMTMIRNRRGFYGGEAQGDETPWNSFPFLAFEAAYAGTAYLNADYDGEVHARWADFSYTEEAVTADMENVYENEAGADHAVFDPVYGGKNGIEYLRDRLGYRLVLRAAYLDAEAAGGTVHGLLRIQNTGFGRVVNEKEAVLLFVSEDGTVYERPLSFDIREVLPDMNSRPDNEDAWHGVSFAVPVSGPEDSLPDGKYTLYLRIRDPKEQSENRRCIRFANGGGQWDETLGANRIGETAVIS